MRCKRASSALILSLALLALAQPLLPALAHADLISADPVPGAQLRASPSEVRLTFNQPLESGSTLAVFTTGFQVVPGLLPAIDPQSPDQLYATLPRLEPGSYTVQWKAIERDSHQTSGSYSFSLATSASQPVVAILTIVALVALSIEVVWRWTHRSV